MCQQLSESWSSAWDQLESTWALALRLHDLPKRPISDLTGQAALKWTLSTWGVDTPYIFGPKHENRGTDRTQAIDVSFQCSQSHKLALAPRKDILCDRDNDLLPADHGWLKHGSAWFKGHKTAANGKFTSFGFGLRDKEDIEGNAIRTEKCRLE